MDEKKITFIICVNDLWYYEECVRYIKELYVPDGHSIDILCIQEADSMAQGYNGGCEAADAKYKSISAPGYVYYKSQLYL